MTTVDEYTLVEPGSRPPRSAMADISEIIEYWTEQNPDWLASYMIGWGEAFCFGCGWLAPGRRGPNWIGNSHLLDRAHLQDHAAGGSGDPENLVMLCHLCHEAMPDFSDREQALRWVQAVPEKNYLWQLWTDTVAESGGLRSATRGSTLNRLKGRFLETILVSGDGLGEGEAARVAASFNKNNQGEV